MENIFPEVRLISTVAKQILSKRYFFPMEKSWDQLVRRNVNHVFDDGDGDKDITEQMILNRYFLPNSPSLANAGKPDPGMCACYVVDFNDTIEEIYKTKYEFALVARRGGGCGTTLSKLRPRGDDVRGSTHGFAGGPIAFADTISRDMQVITQGGLRSMAIMFTMSVYHPDIVQFITAKENEDDKKIENANMSVVVDNVFMNLVKENKKYWTVFNGKKYKEYNAKDIFDMIVEGAWRNGEPGVLFQDRINDSPYKYTGQEILSTNPSLRKGTKILTNLGISSIEELENKKFKVMNLNGKWSNAECFLSGKNKKLTKITFSGGVEYFCTPEHKWPVLLENGSMIKSLTADLEEGDRIPVNTSEKKYGDLGNYSDGFLIGWIYGDGWITKRKDNGKTQVGIIVSNKDAENGVKDSLSIKLKELGVETSWPIRKNRQSLWYEINTCNQKLIDFLNKFGVKNKRDGLPSKIWNDCSKKFVLGFLDGIISSDGYIDKNRIDIVTAHKTLAKELQEFLGFLGICVHANKRMSYGNFNTKKKYEAYDVVFSTRFAEKWKITNQYKNSELRKFKNKKDYYFRIIDSIEETNLLEDVWDIRVDDKTHCFSLANVITGNCSEQPLPPNGVCNLGSFDLSKFVKKDESFDFEKFEIAVRLGVRYLDKIIDKSTYPTPFIAQWSKDNRAIGAGTMGYADACLMMEKAYGSEEALKFLGLVFSFMQKISLDESEKLGVKFSVPEECQKLPIPRRNITVNTVAPTGTVSLIAGCSSGLEPIFSEVVIRNDKTGTYIFENNLAEKPYFRCAVSTNGSEKEVTWEEHIRTLAEAQKYIDSGVSKTINFPTHTHRDTIGKAFFMAWEMGCKGLAVYRNGSRKQEVLSPKNIKQDKCPKCDGEIVTINNFKKCMSCDWNLKV